MMRESREKTYKEGDISCGMPPSFPFAPPDREEKKGISGKFFLLLFIAVLFHALFFLLFHPIKNERSIKTQGKGFVLLLDPKNAKERAKEYSLEYFLTYSDPAYVMKIQKDHSFGAWEKLSEKSPFSRELIRKNPGKTFSGKEETKDDPGKSVMEKRSLAELTDFTFSSFLTSGGQKKVPSAAFAPVDAKDFPVWSFDTGEGIRGALTGFSGKERTLLEEKAEKAVSYTQYRIFYSEKKGVPPVLKLMRSCQVKELDELAEKELYRYLGASFRNRVSGKKPHFCTILWSPAPLLLPQKEGKYSKTGKNEEGEISL